MKKYSVCLFGHFTSITIEEEFLETLKKIAKDNKKSVAKLIAEIDEKRKVNDNLSSAIRVWILEYVRKNN